MQARKWFSWASCAGLMCAGLLVMAGCRKTNSVDKDAFKTAINGNLSVRPACVWAEARKFPAQADTANDEQTKGFDALTDAGLLVRSSAEKKRFLIGSKQVNDYDLSAKGRSTWTADPSQPGYGNFCYGHRTVKVVDNFTPADNPDATQYTVNYHADVEGLPAWASTAEMQTAFPQIASDVTGQPGTAILVKSANGWQVTNAGTTGGMPPLPQ